ncbi:hypothetical protein [Cohnella hashimotonis]|uniref:Uncharacterized protein n=1 Tax=Cohnella hashimotonis TaxID=2826895 RepID=A0ABT6TQH6_9BACL|nr:hypothetical protein [Cohnella hashimotonis]MDI4648072.1 hypothetical protein [Cohnella hashimotonis]
MSWPTVLFTHPDFVVLPVHAHALQQNGVFNLEPQEIGLRFVVADIETKEDFERNTLDGDAFMGSWVTQQVAVAKM